MTQSDRRIRDPFEVVLEARRASRVHMMAYGNDFRFNAQDLEDATDTSLRLLLDHLINDEWVADDDTDVTAYMKSLREELGQQGGCPAPILIREER